MDERLNGVCPIWNRCNFVYGVNDLNVACFVFPPLPPDSAPVMYPPSAIYPPLPPDPTSTKYNQMFSVKTLRDSDWFLFNDDSIWCPRPDDALKRI